MEEEDEGSKKTHFKSRKAYTVTKAREVWTPEEHSAFLEALQLYERDWKKIEEYVKTKTVIQIRSHAQKYFLKLQKQGMEADIPAPRNKKYSSRMPSSERTGTRSASASRVSSPAFSAQDEGMYAGRTRS